MSLISEKVRDTIIKCVKKGHPSFNELSATDDSTFDDMGADSLTQVEIFMELEREFKINIPETAIEKIKSIHDAITFMDTALVDMNQDGDKIKRRIQSL